MARMEQRLTARESSVTSWLDVGKEIRGSATIDGKWFEHRRLAVWDPGKAGAYPNTADGMHVKAEWEGAKNENDLQQCLNCMIPGLLHMNPCQEARYFDTHLSGLEGNLLKIDCTVADRDYRAPPHVATFLEAKYDLIADHARVVGEVWGRIERLRTTQPQRDYWWAAIVGKSQFQLWEFPSKGWGGAYCSALTSFHPDASSPGFQLFARWVWTNFQMQGFIPPQLPPPVCLNESQHIVFTGKLLENASHAEGDTKLRPDVRVFKGVIKPGEEPVIAKLPASCDLAEKECQNLDRIRAVDGIQDHVVRLVQLCEVSERGLQGLMLVLRPKAEHIPEEITTQQLMLYVRQLVNILKLLEQAGLLHLDLSFYNLLYYRGQPLLSDMQTLRSIQEAGSVEWATGTPLFMALRVLRREGHTISTELESVLYVIIFVLSKRHLPWRHIPSTDTFAAAARFGLMTFEFERRVLNHVNDDTGRAWVRRLRDLFFSGGKYKTTVTCDQFLAQCQ